MLFFKHFVLCALALVGITCNSPEVLSGDLLGTQGNNYLRCGEIFRCTSGTFRYKSPDPKTRPERCVWLLSAPGAVKYAIKFNWPINYWPSSPNPDSLKYSGLLVTTVRYDNDTLDSTPLFSTDTTVNFDANVVVLTYYSEPFEGISQMSEFVVSFHVTQEFGSQAEIAADHSEYSLLLPDSLPYRHPRNSKLSNSPTYGSVELSIIVLVPRNNFSDSSGRVKISYIRLVDGSDIGCRLQGLSVYSLKKETDFIGFRSKGTFCEDITSFTLVTTDLTLVVLTSIRNASDVNRGFKLIFVD